MQPTDNAQIGPARPISICNKYALLIFGALTILARPTAACECYSAPACQYISHSDVIFLGKVTYSNDDGSGTFVQATLIRFEVEEAFKGLAPDVHKVWVDPGSFTSCYADYPVGKRYLVFASSKWDFGQFIALTIVNGPRGRKPPPQGFDPNNPPTVYLSPECTGTREVSAKTEEILTKDLASLRAWKEGESTTRVYGRVLDDHRPAWPMSNPPALQGATVTLEGAAQKLTAVTDSQGTYSFEGIPSGQYSLSTLMNGYRAFPAHVAFDLAPGTCAYNEIDMVTDGTLEGTVKNHLGGPAARIEVIAQRLLPGGAIDFIGYTLTDKNGAFRFSDLPGGDFRLGVNIDRRPTVDEPYPPFYFPGMGDPPFIHLNLREHRKGLTLNLPPPLKTRTVEVAVMWADSTPAAGADVWASWDDGGTAEFAQTDKSGHAKLPCLADVAYKIEAKKWLHGSGLVGHVAAKSEPFNLPAGSWTSAIKLALVKASNHY